MSVLDNIDGLLNDQFRNSNLLPQKLEIRDFDKAIKDHFSSFNLSVVQTDGNLRPVPVHWLNQELWAERRSYWFNMTNENGKEMSKPFMAIVRKGIKQGTSPLKYTIPVKKAFTYVKVPKFNGSTKEFDLIKIPQPTYIDIDYELRFVTSYYRDLNKFYETLFNRYSDLQSYMNVNGHQIRSIISEPSEDHQVEIDDERIFQVSVPIVVHGKLIDPKDYKRVNTISKIKINMKTKGNS
jgi:hypothetical protein